MAEGDSLDELLEQVNAASRNASAHTATTVAPSKLEQPWSPQLVLTLAGGILLFGIVVCAVMAFLMLRGRRPTELLRAFSLPLIIVSAVFLVVTGYSDQQISSVIGLLGAIAGYILGSNGRSAIKANDDGKKPSSSAATGG